MIVAGKVYNPFTTPYSKWQKASEASKDLDEGFVLQNKIFFRSLGAPIRGINLFFRPIENMELNYQSEWRILEYGSNALAVCSMTMMHEDAHRAYHDGGYCTQRIAMPSSISSSKSWVTYRKRKHWDDNFNYASAVEEYVKHKRISGHVFLTNQAQLIWISNEDVIKLVCADKDYPDVERTNHD